MCVPPLFLQSAPRRMALNWKTGTLQADAYGGCNDLYRAERAPAPVLSASFSESCVGHMPDARFSNWPTLPGTFAKANQPTTSPRSLWRPWQGLTPCSISSLVSKACPPKHIKTQDKGCLARWSRTCTTGLWRSGRRCPSTPPSPRPSITRSKRTAAACLHPISR